MRGAPVNLNVRPARHSPNLPQASVPTVLQSFYMSVDRRREDMNRLPVAIAREQLVAFCQRWKIRELAVFGSVLRADFSPHSDIDLLVTFDEYASWGLFEHVQMQQELEQLLKRKVDLLTRRAVEQSKNPIRRHAILSTARPLIAA